MKRLAFILFTVLTVPVFSQTTLKDDTSSVDKIVKAVYEIISGPAGQRDWNRFKNLFESDASMGTIYRNKEDQNVYKKFTPDDYIASNDAYFLKNDFTEKEISRGENILKDLAQVFSSYEYVSGDKKQKGVNTFLLFYYKNRWWIGSLVWKEENLADIAPDVKEK
jgi:hypothetical protein